MGADFRFPSAEQRTMLRTAPRLELPSPAGNPAHNLAMPAADTPASSSASVGCDWILELPALSTVRSPDPGASSEPARAPRGPAKVLLSRETPAPAASPSGNRKEAAPAGAFVGRGYAVADGYSYSEFPLPALDRTGTRPAGNVGEEGESPSPAPDQTVGVSNTPAAGSPSAVSPASSGAAIGVPVAAMEAVMIERMKHFDNGHDLASDVAAIADNPRKLSRRAERFIVLAIEDLQFHRAGFRTRAKHHIAQAAAMLLAFHDAVDAMEDPSDAV